MSGALVDELLIAIGLEGLAIVRLAFTVPGAVSEIATTGVFKRASSSALNLVIGSASKWICWSRTSDLIFSLSNSASISFLACSRRASSCRSRITIARSIWFSFTNRSVSSGVAPFSLAVASWPLASSSCARRSAIIFSESWFAFWLVTSWPRSFSSCCFTSSSSCALRGRSALISRTVVSASVNLFCRSLFCAIRTWTRLVASPAIFNSRTASSRSRFIVSRSCETLATSLRESSNFDFASELSFSATVRPASAASSAFFNCVISPCSAAAAFWSLAPLDCTTCKDSCAASSCSRTSFSA